MTTEPRRIYLLAGKATVYLGLIVGTFALIFYLQFYQPEVVKRLILAVDVLGVTPLGEEEQLRQTRINQLSITYEEKQVLLSRTVFLGATQQMVTLALGTPKEQKHTAQGTLYIYYLPDDPRPTILRFKSDKLAHAYKGSALDLAAGG
jgi:hypothetical protein